MFTWDGGIEKGQTEAHLKESYEWVGHILWWIHTSCSESHHLRYWSPCRWGADSCVICAGLCVSVEEQSGCSHLGRGSCAWWFLPTLVSCKGHLFKISIIKPKRTLPSLWVWWGQALPFPWIRGIDVIDMIMHIPVNNSHPLRTSLAFHRYGVTWSYWTVYGSRHQMVTGRDESSQEMVITSSSLEIL